MTQLSTLADPEAVAQRAAREIAVRLRSAIERRGRAHLALSGGTTPQRAYELLAGAEMDWEAVEVWFADERCVGPEDEQSNYRMARETLLETAGVPARRVHRMEGELGAEQAALRYAERLRELAPAAASGSPLPCLDVIVLGIGPDGHVASLFPGAESLHAGPEAICLPVHGSPKPPPDRVTLSLAMLHAARRCVLLATGAGKADAMSAALGAASPHVPASLLRRERLIAIVDDSAAPTGALT